MTDLKLESKGCFPEPRAFHACSLVSNRIIVISGGVSQQQEVLSDLFLFYLNTNIFTSVMLKDEVKGCYDQNAIITSFILLLILLYIRI